MKHLGLAATAFAMVLANNQPSIAELTTADFICSVQPGYRTPSMPLKVRVEPTRLVISLATDPPSIGYWLLLDNSPVGLVAASGSAAEALGIRPFVSGSMFFIMRSTGTIRWTEAGTDTLPITDRTGTCVDAHSSVRLNILGTTPGGTH